MLSMQTQASLLGLLITFVNYFHFNLVVMFVFLQIYLQLKTRFKCSNSFYYKYLSLAQDVSTIRQTLKHIWRDTHINNYDRKIFLSGFANFSRSYFNVRKTLLTKQTSALALVKNRSLMLSQFNVVKLRSAKANGR